MTNTDDPKKATNHKSSKAKRLEAMMFGKHWQITVRVIGITIGTIAIFAGIGHWIDTAYATAPAGLIAGVILAYPVAQFIVYKEFKKITK